MLTHTHHPHHRRSRSDSVVSRINAASESKTAELRSKSPIAEVISQPSVEKKEEAEGVQQPESYYNKLAIDRNFLNKILYEPHGYIEDLPMINAKALIELVIRLNNAKIEECQNICDEIFLIIRTALQNKVDLLLAVSAAAERVNEYQVLVNLFSEAAQSALDIEYYTTLLEKMQAVYFALVKKEEHLYREKCNQAVQISAAEFPKETYPYLLTGEIFCRSKNEYVIKQLLDSQSSLFFNAIIAAGQYVFKEPTDGCDLLVRSEAPRDISSVGVNHALILVQATKGQASPSAPTALYFVNGRDSIISPIYDQTRATPVNNFPAGQSISTFTAAVYPRVTDHVYKDIPHLSFAQLQRIISILGFFPGTHLGQLNEDLPRSLKMNHLSLIRLKKEGFLSDAYTLKDLWEYLYMTFGEYAITIIRNFSQQFIYLLSNALAANTLDPTGLPRPIIILQPKKIIQNIYAKAGIVFREAKFTINEINEEKKEEEENEADRQINQDEGRLDISVEHDEELPRWTLNASLKVVSWVFGKYGFQITHIGTNSSLLLNIMMQPEGYTYLENLVNTVFESEKEIQKQLEQVKEKINLSSKSKQPNNERSEKEIQVEIVVYHSHLKMRTRHCEERSLRRSNPEESLGLPRLSPPRRAEHSSRLRPQPRDDDFALSSAIGISQSMQLDDEKSKQEIQIEVVMQVNKISDDKKLDESEEKIALDKMVIGKAILDSALNLIHSFKEGQITFDQLSSEISGLADQEESYYSFSENLLRRPSFLRRSISLFSSPSSVDRCLGKIAERIESVQANLDLNAKIILGEIEISRILELISKMLQEKNKILQENMKYFSSIKDLRMAGLLNAAVHVASKKNLLPRDIPTLRKHIHSMMNYINNLKAINPVYEACRRTLIHFKKELSLIEEMLKMLKQRVQEETVNQASSPTNSILGSLSGLFRESPKRGSISGGSSPSPRRSIVRSSSSAFSFFDSVPSPRSRRRVASDGSSASPSLAGSQRGSIVHSPSGKFDLPSPRASSSQRAASDNASVVSAGSRRGSALSGLPPLSPFSGKGSGLK